MFMSGCIFRLSIAFVSRHWLPVLILASMFSWVHPLVFSGTWVSLLVERNICVGEWICKFCETLSRTIKCQRMLLAAQIVGYTYSTNKFVFSTYTILFVLKVDLWVATDYVFDSLSSEFIVLKYRMRLCKFQHDITCQYANDWSRATAWFVLTFLGHPT